MIPATKSFTSQIINAVYKNIRIGVFLSLFFCVMICDIIALGKCFLTMAKGLVYTNEKCVGCNKCIAVCSAMGACISTVADAKGNSRINVDPSRCVGCGACFNVCEHGAREYCDDTDAFFADLEAGKEISVLVAPSFRAN